MKNNTRFSNAKYKTRHIFLKCVGIIVCCMGLLPPNLIAQENQDILIESLDKDMDYYHRMVLPYGEEAGKDFLKKIIEKYEAKGLDEMYLIPMHKALEKNVILGRNAAEWRKEEPHGVGFSFFGSQPSGLSGFYDFNLSPMEQLHIELSDGKIIYEIRGTEIRTSTVDRLMMNISYRRFISRKRGIRRGLYYGLGGGLAKTEFDYSYGSVGYKASGNGLFAGAEIGWQGVRKWYFYFGMQKAYYLWENNNFDATGVPNIANYRTSAQSGWDRAYKLQQTNIGVGYFF